MDRESYETQNMVTRGELCKALGISKSTLRRWEEAGKLTPVIDARGVRMFPENQVRELLGGKAVVHLPKARALVPDAATVGGDLAAEVFERLQRKVSMSKIVIELRIHPDVVLGLAARWARLENLMFLTPEQCRALTRAMRGAPAVTPDELVASVKDVMRQRACKSCRQSFPSYCRDCVVERVREIKARFRPVENDEASSTEEGEESADGVANP